MILSVAIIAGNEERHIGAALQSVNAVADELVVVIDPRTVDRTAAIAEEHGARIVYHPFVSHSQQRNRALDACRGRWVFFLDADERAMPELVAELRSVREQPERPYVGYWIPRHNLYFGQALKGGGWYPDHQLRLLLRSYARYNEAQLVHEYAQLNGEASKLQGHILHINIETWNELHEKQRRYALAEAQTLARAGVRAKWRNLMLQPLREVNRRFITWQGYRDGVLGLSLALIMGYYELLKYVHLKGLNVCDE